MIALFIGIAIQAGRKIEEYPEHSVTSNSPRQARLKLLMEILNTLLLMRTDK